MQFLSLSSAWFGLALPAIALLYVLKRKYDDRMVSSHLLWRHALQEQEANRPWQKLRSRALLIVQLLVALLLVLALMEPVAEGEAEDVGLAVVLIDRSASMTVIPQVPSNQTAQLSFLPQSRFQQMLAAASEWIDEQPNERPISVLVTGDEPEVLATSELNHKQLIEQLQQVVPYYGPSNQVAALSLADAMHQGRTDGITLLFTDGLWQDVSAANALTLQYPSQLMKPDTETIFSNAGIMSFGLREDSSNPGRNHAVITVRNDRTDDFTYTIDLYAQQGDAGSELVTQLSIPVPAGQWQSIEAKDLPPAVYYKAQLRPSEDGYRTDNIAYQFPFMGQMKKVLLVSSGNLFLEKALQLAGVELVKSSPTSRPPSGATGTAFDWVVLDGTADLLRADEDWQQWLSKHAIWQIDHPADGSPTTIIANQSEITITEHPITSYLTFQDTHISRFEQPSESTIQELETIISYGGIPAIYAGRQNGQPAIHFTFKLQDSDLPLRPEFPVLIAQAADWMSGDNLEQLGTATVGQELQLQLHAETSAAEWRSIEHAGSGLPQEQEFLHRPIAISLDTNVRIRAPQLPGLYQLIESDGNQNKLADRYLAVRAHPSEPLFMEANDESLQLRHVGQASDNNEVSSGFDQNKATNTNLFITKSQSLLPWITLFLLLFILIEWEVYRRGHTH